MGNHTAFSLSIFEISRPSVASQVRMLYHTDWPTSFLYGLVTAMSTWLFLQNLRSSKPSVDGKVKLDTGLSKVSNGRSCPDSKALDTVDLPELER